MPAWLIALNRLFPIRYMTLVALGVMALLGAFVWISTGLGQGATVLGLAGVMLGLRDLRQTRHAILRNYPVIGHLRFLLEFVRPELRQYFIESDNEAAPFSRQQRSLVYPRAKGEPDKRPFGTQLDVHREGYEWINHSLAPTTLASDDFRTTIGAGCAQPYSASVFNISAMSFGALSYNFKDTWRIGVGGNYQYNKDLKLRFGMAYDVSPVKSSADRTMTLPDSDRTWISIGAKYQLSPNASVDVGYSHIFFAKENTTRVVYSGTTPIQNIRGEWDNSVDIIAAQLNYKF